MPELPEVETIVRDLARTIPGDVIAGVRVTLSKIAVAPHGVDFTRALRGRQIRSVRRRGKFILIDLDCGATIVVSLRMTGRLIVLKGKEAAPRHTHVVLRLRSGRRLAFADSRQFGRMRVVPEDDQWDAALGVEPLSGDFTPERFIGMLSGRTTPIKAFLLDQRRIAGVGNIYACEALWRARIRPGTPARVLTGPAIRRLHRDLIEVLQRSIAMRGTSVDDYVDAQGHKGGFQNALSVYGRAGLRCERCGRVIVRTVLRQRGTWWCRRCQK
ncbi:MAG TPA: bifunctional DNA-formamidopyrimidine glycosylase/DNA-(apurinic or apyrimidinic site) lyase [Candidatus Rubrimentiphilum sp.]|nr:bifunctional DNA-formamidopyrimidine glycosylase/DNA-(apurinic or apyrimidinic site) lyase [Candidatus Rubrimentiphilum sp.]